MLDQTTKHDISWFPQAQLRKPGSKIQHSLASHVQGPRDTKELPSRTYHRRTSANFSSIALQKEKVLPVCQSVM